MHFHHALERSPCFDAMHWTYRAPWWLPGGNLQTIGPALWGRRHPRTQAFRRERWRTPDGDFIDVDHLPEERARPSAPVLVLFHGLEGSSASHYAQAFARQAVQRGWRLRIPHFRGCSGEINLAPRVYHSGDFEEIGWILRRVRESLGSTVPLLAVGVSLGGNALLRWAQEAGETAGRTVGAVAAVSSPLDLTAAGHAIDKGFNRQVYARMFLRTMKHKARQKWAQYPGLFDLERALAATTLQAFDDAFTAPVHGFLGVHDYWRRASAKPGMRELRLPTLVLNARNDPFVPFASLPTAAEVPSHVALWQPRHGGHVGFAGRARPPSGRVMQVDAMPQAVCQWLARAAGVSDG
ncbi:YheT family hydrolase [Tepidicella baoligensis]|uniref:YheT family hydrolase n=1 Tax=Tepidicella baoligensis TaxID=2707016 RepID=UPI001FE71248|nr:alpha/beta fold hydrolase [Tepidicella baoligensis]